MQISEWQVKTTSVYTELESMLNALAQENYEIFRIDVVPTMETVTGYDTTYQQGSANNWTTREQLPKQHTLLRTHTWVILAFRY